MKPATIWISLVMLLLALTGGLAVQAYMTEEPSQGALPQDNGLAAATFAGGCFWCIEEKFEKLTGVSDAITGYAGGNRPHPNYEEVASGHTGHAESVQVYYRPDQIGFADLVDAYWRMIDPMDGDGQFRDRGSAYRPIIFYRTDAEREIAEAQLHRLADSGRFSQPLAVSIQPLEQFYAAEERHQNYSQRHPYHYKFYRYLSGRDQFIENAWGEGAMMEPTRLAQADNKPMKPTKEELKRQLTPMQYKVTQREGTEPPFQNDYWDEKREGIYVDIVSGEPLFSSLDKFDSGTGWPSFTRPLEAERVVEKKDFKMILPRTEVRSRDGDSHLGHLFDDGPQPSGLRYCVNSAALRFIPKEKLEEEGYEQYLVLFEKSDAK